MIFNDVKALFTSVPLDPATSICQKQTSTGTFISVYNLHVYPKNHYPTRVLPENTYFLFQGKYFEQVHGAAMGSSISPLIVNLFMEEFESKAITSASNPHRLWLRYMDNIFAMQQVEHDHHFLQLINCIDAHMQFAMDNPKEDTSIPFLDTLVSLGPKNTLITSTYRKPHQYRPVSSLGQQTTSYHPNTVCSIL